MKELKENNAVTQNGSVRFKKAIFATHFPIDNKHGLYFFKMYQHRSYVIALENAAQLDGMYVDENIKGMSFRNYKNLLLVGGGDHRTGKTGGNWDQLRNFAKKYNPYQAVFNPSRSMLKPQLLVNGFEATKNLLTISTKRCPHMGCALKWNEVEHSWDCPCHGSRFGEDGILLNNPANGDKMIDD